MVSNPLHLHIGFARKTTLGTLRARRTSSRDVRNTLCCTLERIFLNLGRFLVGVIIAHCVLARVTCMQLVLFGSSRATGQHHPPQHRERLMRDQSACASKCAFAPDALTMIEPHRLLGLLQLSQRLLPRSALSAPMAALQPWL